MAVHLERIEGKKDILPVVVRYLFQALMATTKLSSKGQLTIPKSVREQQKWRKGQAFEITVQDGNLLLRPLSLFPKTSLDDVAGCLSYEGPTIPVDEHHGGRVLQRRIAAHKPSKPGR